MEEEKQYWTVEDLESLTDTVQEAEVKYQEKYIKVSWCELTESEEPKAIVVDDSLSEEEKNEQYLELAKERIGLMMKKAQDKMTKKIENTNFLTPKPGIISNVTAKEENDTKQIKTLLVDQIISKVRWRESVDYMIKNGVNEFIEIGPGKVLSGLVKKINKDAKITNINMLDNINT